MWEFSINISSYHADLARFLYDSLKTVVQDLKGVVTSYESQGEISVLVACDEIEKSRLEFHVQNCVANAICLFLKEEFLDARLILPLKSELEIFAFKKALISFDRETDRFLINKFLVCEKTLELESFFHFRLKALKEKWTELVNIANDNSTYLLGEDSFIELLKFLIDNIDIASEEVFVELTNDGANVCMRENMTDKNCVNKFSLVDFLMTNSPRKINWSASTPDIFLEKIFSKRIVYGKKI